MTDLAMWRPRLRDLAAERFGLAVAPIHDSRLDQALAALAPAGSITMADALAMLETRPWDDPLWQKVIERITVGETSFLRHREWFGVIEQHVLVPLIDERRQRGPRRLRLWSAACSTGEEPYTLAMLVDRLVPDRSDWDITIVGTDINAASLATAQQAVYREWSLRELDAAERSRHFTLAGANQFELKATYRAMVAFRRLNLSLDDYPGSAGELGDFDLILCRNASMYWTPEVQAAAAQRLCRCLAPGGWLALSPAEAIAEWYRLLVPVNFPAATLFRNLPLSAAPRSTPPLPLATVPRPDSDRPSRSRVGSRARTVHRRATPAPSRSDAVRPVSSPPPPPPSLSPPSQVENEIAEARSLADRGMLEMARRRCEAILARDSLDSEVNLLLAAICTELGDLTTALEAARRATYLAPHSAAAHFQLGSTYGRMGHAAQAQRCMEAVLSLLAPLPDDAPVALLAETTTAGLRHTARAFLTGAAGRSRGG